MSPRLHLRVAHTWDGRPVSDPESSSIFLSREPSGLRVRVDAPYFGDPPPPGPPGPTDRLWEREVVELFVLGEGERYLEVELAPSGHHLVLRLEGVRQPFAKLLPLEFQASRRSDRWTGEALLPDAWRPPGALKVNAFAIHGTGEGRRYLAATPLPGPQPDFHRLGHFVTPLSIW